MRRLITTIFLVAFGLLTFSSVAQAELTWSTGTASATGIVTGDVALNASSHFFKQDTVTFAPGSVGVLSTT